MLHHRYAIPDGTVLHHEEDKNPPASMRIRVLPKGVPTRGPGGEGLFSGLQTAGLPGAAQGR